MNRGLISVLLCVLHCICEYSKNSSFICIHMSILGRKTFDDGVMLIVMSCFESTVQHHCLDYYCCHMISVVCFYWSLLLEPMSKIELLQNWLFSHKFWTLRRNMHIQFTSRQSIRWHRCQFILKVRMRGGVHAKIHACPQFQLNTETGQINIITTSIPTVIDKHIIVNETMIVGDWLWLWHLAQPYTNKRDSAATRHENEIDTNKWEEYTTKTKSNEIDSL